MSLQQTQCSEEHLTGSRAGSRGLKNGGVQPTAGARETAAKNAEILSSLATICLYMSGQLSITCSKLVMKQPVSNLCHGEEPGQQCETGVTRELKGIGSKLREECKSSAREGAPWL